MDASPLPSPGPKKAQHCYVTPASLEVPNAKRGEQIRVGCLNPAFSGARKRAELLCNPCILGGPRREARGENHMRKIGRSCYVTFAFLGVPNAKHG